MSDVEGREVAQEADVADEVGELVVAEVKGQKAGKDTRWRVLWKARLEIC